MKIYEGEYDTPIQGAFCGANYPTQIITNSRRMVIELHSDDHGADTGFRIKIETGRISIPHIKINVNMVSNPVICTGIIEVFV